MKKVICLVLSITFGMPIAVACKKKSNDQMYMLMMLLGGGPRLPKTGQTACYDKDGNPVLPCTGTGQDGELQKGIAWPSPRFTNADGTTPVSGNVVIDRLTGLMWVKNANPAGTKTWADALAYVAGMNSGANSNFGYTDWRLPNIRELVSLVNYGSAYEPATWLGNQGFTNVQVGTYWSSTTLINTPASAWCVDFSVLKGESSYNPKSSAFYVWSVRGNSTGPYVISKTGQTSCYDSTGSTITCSGSGQDGELQKGAPWPSSRFLVSGNVVIDLLTSLMWTKSANLYSGTRTWQQTLDYVAGMNNGINSNFGYKDWRVPNIVEYLSLANYGEDTLSTWLNAQGFTSVQGNNYWSSNPYPWASGGWSWMAGFNLGYGSVNTTNVTYYVWAVRDQ